MKEYKSPMSYNFSEGGIRGAIPAILGMAVGAVAAGAAMGGLLGMAAKAKEMNLVGEVSPKNKIFYKFANFKVETYA